MNSFSIIILAKNEERNIARTLEPLIGMSDDVMLLDNGSTDQTIIIAQKMGVRVEAINWTGYADTKNRGNQKAKYDWILSLDADEEINHEMKNHIMKLMSENQLPNQAWMLKRKLVYGNKILHFGSVSNEYRIRLFNRKNACWNQNEVHEDIEFSTPLHLQKVKGYLLHHSYPDILLHQQKTEKYAQLFAQQMKQQNQIPSLVKRYMSPLFGFVKNYIFRLGFLDGKQGFGFAYTEMKYTFLKYKLASKY